MSKYSKEEERILRTVDPLAGYVNTKAQSSARESFKRVKSMHRLLLRGKTIHPILLAGFRNANYKLTEQDFNEITKKCPFSLDEWGVILGIDNFPEVVGKIEYFPPLYTEKILETLLLCNLGKEIYGNEEDFKRWLDQPPLSYFGGRSPKELLCYSSGFNELHQALQIIDYGQTA